MYKDQILTEVLGVSFMNVIRFSGEEESCGGGRREMEEEEDCGDGCWFKGREVGSVFFFSYVKNEFSEMVFLPALFFHVRKPLFK